MKIETYKEPKSSFLSVEKDASILIDLFLRNNNLKKLLYYTSADCLKKQNLTEDESLKLIGKNIRMVPKLEIDEPILNYIIISFDHFQINKNNPEFRDNLIEFDIVCHFNQWQLSDFQLRPYRIAAEIDSMLHAQNLTNFGKMKFINASQEVINDEFAELCLLYHVIHGEEDKKFMPNPNNEQQMIDNFNEIFNS